MANISNSLKYKINRFLDGEYYYSKLHGYFFSYTKKENIFSYLASPYIFTIDITEPKGFCEIHGLHKLTLMDILDYKNIINILDNSQLRDVYKAMIKEQIKRELN